MISFLHAIKQPKRGRYIAKKLKKRKDTRPVPAASPKDFYQNDSANSGVEAVI